jgi:hypothetical protein
VLERQRVVARRRARLRKILDRALLDADADLDIALAMLTGNWYARALAGDPPPRRLSYRTAALVWRALGGQPPREPSGAR